MTPKSLLATLTLMAMAAAPPAPLAAQEAEPLDTESVVEAIDVGPYEVPDLPLKKRRRYAATAEDLDPFRHVEPFQEHFLEQMEYTGPGRSIPEPDRTSRSFDASNEISVCPPLLVHTTPQRTPLSPRSPIRRP